MNEEETAGWAVGQMTLTDETGERTEHIALSVLCIGRTVAISTSSAKALVRQLLLLIDDAEKANEESK